MADDESKNEVGRRWAASLRLKERRLKESRREQLSALVKGLEDLAMELHAPGKKASLGEVRKGTCAALIAMAQLMRQEVWRCEEEAVEVGMRR